MIQSSCKAIDIVVIYYSVQKRVQWNLPQATALGVRLRWSFTGLVKLPVSDHLAI